MKKCIIRFTLGLTLIALCGLLAPERLMAAQEEDALLLGKVKIVQIVPYHSGDATWHMTVFTEQGEIKSLEFKMKNAGCAMEQVSKLTESLKDQDVLEYQGKSDEYGRIVVCDDDNQSLVRILELSDFSRDTSQCEQICQSAGEQYNWKNSSNCLRNCLPIGDKACETHTDCQDFPCHQGQCLISFCDPQTQCAYHCDTGDYCSRVLPFREVRNRGENAWSGSFGLSLSGTDRKFFKWADFKEYVAGLPPWTIVFVSTEVLYRSFNFEDKSVSGKEFQKYLSSLGLEYRYNAGF